MNKLLLQAVASQLTAAVMSSLAPMDPQAAQNLACQLQANFYGWLLAVCKSPDWPEPDLDMSKIGGSFGGTLIAALQTFLGGSGRLSQLVQALLQSIPLPPQPGANNPLPPPVITPPGTNVTP